MELNGDVKGVIEDYLSNNKLHSLHTLAQKSGVGYSTIRRLAQGEGQPSADSVLSLISVALAPTERLSFLNKHFPGIGDFNVKMEPKYIADEGKNFRSLPLHNHIFNLSATSNGTTIETISRKFGEVGMKALDEMVDSQVLVREKDGRIFYKEESWAVLAPNELLEQIKYSTDYFDKSLLGTKAARISHLTASLNANAVKLIHEKVTECCAEISKIKDSVNSKGEIPVFVDLMMNCYDADKISGEL